MSKKQGMYAPINLNVRHTENIQILPSFHGPDIVYKFNFTGK
jgi:hypothetical protein